MNTNLKFQNTGTQKTYELILSVVAISTHDSQTKSKVINLALRGNGNEIVEKEIQIDQLLSFNSIKISMSDDEGNELIDLSYDPEAFLGLEDSVIEFTYDATETLQEPSLFNKTRIFPNYFTGRLLDKNGRQSLEGIQLIFYARKKDEDEHKILETVKTESNGYFSAPYPIDYFKEAFAVAGINGNSVSIPIQLEEDDSASVTSGRGRTNTESTLIFPQRVILVYESPIDSLPYSNEIQEGCGSMRLGEKRVLEEYSYFSVVRTTEPALYKLTLYDGNQENQDVEGVDTPKIDYPKKPILPSLNPKLSNVLTNTVQPLGDVRTIPKSQTTVLDPPKSAVNLDFKLQPAVIQKDFNRLTGSIINAPRAPIFPGRVVLNPFWRIDWDEDPTIYQAAQVAHGHVLQYKTEWVADGYSLGDLLYSLPLAPGQKKQIVIFDWDRRETAVNSESVDFDESYDSTLSRDRDINEIAAGTMNESMQGKSKAKTWSASASGGFFGGGGFLGASAGIGGASSTASQQNSRQVTSSDFQKLRDRINQAANSARSLRSTVIKTVSQGETFEISAESVANYNHCHALTIQYFEVLRHFKIRQRFAGARECLFVPLIMSLFDSEKAHRWKEVLKYALLDNSLARAIDANSRVLYEWKGLNIPDSTYAESDVLFISGQLTMRLDLPRPKDPMNMDKWDDVEHLWIWLSHFGISQASIHDLYKKYLLNSDQKDALFEQTFGPLVAKSIPDKLRLKAVDKYDSENDIDLNLDFTLTSNYGKSKIISLNVRSTTSSRIIRRDSIQYLKLVLTGLNDNVIPEGFSANILSFNLSYQGEFLNNRLLRETRVNDDISKGDGALFYCAPSGIELVNPTEDDQALAWKLLKHLNDNLEHYHKAIWLSMSPDRRYMLLDGIKLNGKGMGKSVASLVDNDLLGIVGNSLIFPVAPGLNLDPNFERGDSLFDKYNAGSPEPISISIPTKGVFAEAMMGKCNSCEEIDDTRFWKWEEHPIPDSPTTIEPINTGSRRSEMGDMSASTLPSSLVGTQNIPDAPSPAGLAAAIGLLGKGDAFKDLTGLELNQKNALKALETSYKSTDAATKAAAELSKQKMMENRLDRALKNIGTNPNLTEEQRQELTEATFKAYLGSDEKSTKDAEKKTGIKDVGQVVKEAGGGKATIEKNADGSEKISLETATKEFSKHETSFVKAYNEWNVLDYLKQFKDTGKFSKIARFIEPFFNLDFEFEITSEKNLKVRTRTFEVNKRISFDHFVLMNDGDFNLTNCGKVADLSNPEISDSLLSIAAEYSSKMKETFPEADEMVVPLDDLLKKEQEVLALTKESRAKFILAVVNK